MDMNIIKDIYIIGDIHGKFGSLEKKINGYINTDFIGIGDVQIGTGFHNKDVYDDWMPVWNDYLKSKNNRLFLFRGNHDEPSYYKEKKIDLSNIILLDDYTILKLSNKNILCLGGAISVDRFYRRKNITYWEDENFEYDEEAITKASNIDIVLSHTAPNHFHPKGYMTKYLQGFYNLDKTLKDELILERDLMRRAYDILTEKSLFGENKNNIKKWIYGHFHKSHMEIINDIECRCLTELEFYKL